jgi:hypothetical protein
MTANVNRKEFLAIVGTGVAAAAAWSPQSLLAESGEQVESTYTLGMFQPYVGQTFRITSADKSVRMDELDVTLQAVEDRTTGPEAVQFSLEFMGPAGDPIASKTYLFRHPELGSVPMFVSPARKDSQGRTFYRADFNILQNARAAITPPSRRRR